MKICFFTDDITKIGGIERVTSILCSELYQGYEIDIVSIFKGRDKTAYPFPKEIEIRYLTKKKHGIKPHSFKRTINLLKTLTIVRRYFKKNNYDLVIAQSFPPAFAMFISGFNKNKIIVCEHVYAWYYNKIIQNIRKYIYNQLRALIVLTSKDKLFFKSYGLKTDIFVIPNPADIDTPSNIIKREPYRLIAAGRLEYQKGFDNLIRSFCEVHKLHPEWVLDIYGKGSLKDELQNLIDSQHLSESVKLRGITDSLNVEFCKSQIYVLSSHFEGFPMVLIEALSCGLPCIAYDCPNGPSDIITSDNGILVPDQDEKALTEAIIKLIEDENLRNLMQSHAKSSVQRFEKHNIALMWEKLINQFSIYGK
ncbi:MAG: glycosyltransferase family 4 protein [Muribaculum sp.]|nr:glycosyltransferase family 4 protein [Muribaculaceae bacterium]MCM1081310.1 glycosyltransferase family 4 protein [Muribaculum sp.]